MNQINFLICIQLFYLFILIVLAPKKKLNLKMEF